MTAAGPPSSSKPPYSVPTMREVRGLKPNGYRVVSTFSGAGGSCLGFRMAGFRVAWASEFVEAARETYAANFPDVPIDGRDIRRVDPKEILRAIGLRAGELDVLEGSPPCAAFSSAGDRSKKWGQVSTYSDTKQRSDDLFFEFARILTGLRPRAFVAENVSGLVRGEAKGYFLEILAALEAAGYVVRTRLLDAQWLGVPQVRKRVIFVGARKDLGVVPRHPRPLPYRYSLREALELPPGARVVHDTSGTWGAGDVTDRPAPTLTVGMGGINSCHFKVTEGPSFVGQKIEKEWRGLRQGGQSARYMNLIRSHMDRPSQTITATGGHSAGTASVTHPTEPRKFSVVELKRVCSFPYDFELTGSFKQQWERMGRAVPPLMMRAVALEVLAMLREADA